MVRVGTDTGIRFPAAFAFFMGRRFYDNLRVCMVFTSHSISRGISFYESDFTDDKQCRQAFLPLAEEIIVFSIGINRNGCVERMADFMIFTGNFQSTHEITAVRQERIPPFFHIGIEIFRMFFRPVRKQYAFFFSFYSGHVLPYFFGCKGQDRSEDFDQCIENLIHGRLGTAADLGIGFVPDEFILPYDEVLKLDIKEKIPPRDICLAVRKNRMLGAPARELCALIEKTVR